MPGPNSAPNGDTTVVKGHMNEVEIFVQCAEEFAGSYWNGKFGNWISKRDFLLERGRLETGKTHTSHGR